MKFIKKAAALLFCLTLVFSVMAISASADDDPGFTLTLEQADARQNINGDNGGTPDYKGGDTVTYNIKLTRTNSANAYNLNGVEFTLVKDDTAGVLGTPTVTINSTEATVAGNVYQYLSENTNLAAGASYSYIQFASDETEQVIGSISIPTVAPTGTKDSEISSFTVSGMKIHHNRENDTAAYDVTGSATVNAEVHKDYTITLLKPTFDVMTGVIDTTNTEFAGDNVTYNIVDGTGSGAITSPADAMMESVTTYTFTNWTADNAGNWNSATVDKGATISGGKYGNVTLTANYSEATQTATFNYGGADNTPNETVTATYTITTNLSDPTTTPEKAGYDFTGWQVTTGSGKWMTGDTLYGSATDATAFNNSSLTNYYGDVIFTAQFAPHEYTATFEYNHDSVNAGTATYTIETAAAELFSSITDPTRDHYTFAGWNVTTTAGTWTDTSTTYGKDTNKFTAFPDGKYGAVTFTAQWEAVEYSAMFYSDNVLVETVKYTVESTSINAPTPTKAGYKLQSAPWAIATGEGMPSAHNWSAATFTELSGMYGDVRFDAQWEIDGYFETAHYAFAGTADSLILFATNNNITGTYSYNGTAMYQADKYIGMFSEISETDGYHVYVIIATTEGANISAVTFAEGTANDVIAFTSGDINDDNYVNVGDYGTAGSIMAAPNTYTNVDAQHRIMIDMDDSDKSDKNVLGSILDLQAIMAKAATV